MHRFRRFYGNIEILGKSYKTDNWTNITPNIISKIGKNLHLKQYHPLNIIKYRIESYFRQVGKFSFYDSLSPIVTVNANFDSVCVPEGHVSRSKSNTYYINKDLLLRTHTTAHEVELLQKSLGFVTIGDVYRRDEIDSVHYPVFHQVEAVRVFETQDESMVIKNLQSTLEGLLRSLFGDVQFQWIPGEFPFTNPSMELEIIRKDVTGANLEPLEICGCGLLQPSILRLAGLDDKYSAWACGFGLDRLAMVLFQIPDVRLFWTDDQRFIEQFNYSSDTEHLTKKFAYTPYSKHQPISRDVSFWLPSGVEYYKNTQNENHFHDNQINEIFRDIGGDLVESVRLVDTFKHPKTNRTSLCYRTTYRSMTGNLTDEVINELQFKIRDKIVNLHQVELR